MKNFGKMVKMMAVAVVMSAFFCSCNVAGGAAYDDPSEVSSRTQSGIENKNLPSNGGISIKIKEMSISVETDGNRTEVRRGESLKMICTANEGSEEIGMCDWYVGGTKVASGTSFSFNENRPGVYYVSCIAADDATNPLYADSVQLVITVR